MSAKPQLIETDELLPAVDYPAPFESAPEPSHKAVREAQLPALALVTKSDKPSDPLRVIAAMSEEEKIALFS